MKTRLIVFLVFMLGILQASCSPENNQNISTAMSNAPETGDGGFLSDEPCGPPCFFEIVPGITTKNQAISMLQARNLYVDCHEYDNRDPGGVRGISCENISIGLQDDFDIVESIGFMPTHAITLEQISNSFTIRHSRMPLNKVLLRGLSVYGTGIRSRKSDF